MRTSTHRHFGAIRIHDAWGGRNNLRLGIALILLAVTATSFASDEISIDEGAERLPNAISLRDQDVTFVGHGHDSVGSSASDFFHLDSPGSAPQLFTNLDGQTDAFVRPNEAFDEQVEYVDRITFPSTGGRVTELEICLYSMRARSYNVTFVMYNNSGGQPGSLRESQRFSTGTFLAGQGRCFRRDFRATVSSRSAYFGVRFSGTYAPRLWSPRGDGRNPGSDPRSVRRGHRMGASAGPEPRDRCLLAARGRRRNGHFELSRLVDDRPACSATASKSRPPSATRTAVAATCG